MKIAKEPMNPYALSNISMEYIYYIENIINLIFQLEYYFNHESFYRSKNNISMKLINFLKHNKFKRKTKIK